MDVAFAPHDGYDVVVLLDATPRGQRPGTLYVIELDDEEGELGLDTQGMDPVKVIALAHTLGGPLPHTVLIGCEPLRTVEEASLWEPVRASLDQAVRLVDSLLGELTGVVDRRETPRQ